MTASARARILLPALVVACFLPALSADFVNWDDDLNFTLNEHYRGLSGAHLAWMFTTFHGGHYQPLSWLTLGLDYVAWGMHAPGYHLTNVVWHAVNAVLAYALVLALLPTRDVRAAALGALVFAVHPLRVESVAWVTERRDVLSGFFFLSSLLAYLRMQADPARKGRWLVASLACFAASLLAKAWAITLALVLLVLDVYPLRRFGAGRETRNAVLLEKLPYALLGVVFAGIAFVAQQQVPQMRGLAEHGLAARLAQAAYGLTFYIHKTLVPVGLSPAYLLEQQLDPSAPRYVVSLVVAAGLTIAVIALRHRWPWALAAWACYAIVLAPVLGLVQTGPQLVADRYSYLACLPWAVLIAAGVALRGRAAQLGVAAAVVVLAVLTFRQAGVWRDSVTLWTGALRADPRNHVAYVNRGRAYEVRGEHAAALADYSAAIAAKPDYALAFYDRGALRHTMNDLDGAIADDAEALRLNPHDPYACANLGWALDDKGEAAAAAAHYTRALAIAPPDWPHRALIEQRLEALAARRP